MPFFLPKTVTQENALQLEKEGLLNLASLQMVDCSALKDFDSTVLTVLLAWQKKLQTDGHSLVVEHAPEKLKVLAGLYGVSALLGL
ncbi:STAS domain-containing protein [Polynucleobacter sp. MWH-Creno-3A4]|jgi:phospholipid transport system transporter-binding protein|uniref:STAS domain-containing protein n=1 Tax=Polynucleobacter sp. MWH-Creno-3A4 TaxID=1855886 RepID=UPI001C0AA350|nr:STAS domain-containing protein [Polynucleobacter sp. MWH-Creno-3A4]MBU3605919.1 STAS domain-containing protein [Polynucleobacter sp. MWH-Creno-3A4]